MFTVPRPNLIVSSEGFSVEVIGRSQILYREAGRVLNIEAELLATPRTIALYTSSIIAWAPPHDRDELSAAERARVVDNITRAFTSQGRRLEVD